MSHGHVTPRADGMRARCGGPALCSVCRREKQQVEGISVAARALLDSLDATAMKVTPEFRGTLEQLARNPVREGK